jgi:hypothetical protein
MARRRIGQESLGFGFGGVVLPEAIRRTMPPGAPGSLAGDPHPASLLAMCANPPPSDGPFALDGKVTLLRVHDVGTKFGPPNDQLDVEVIVQLNTEPGQAFGFQLRNDTNSLARQGMLNLLRDAFNQNWTVTIDYFIDDGKKHGPIIRAWLTK